MTRIVRQQMICVIAPAWPGAASLSQSQKNSLEALFRDVGVVHFSSMALLPAMADATNHLPSLMLELCVEEGISPHDLLYRLVHHPGDAMWSLYQAYWSHPPALRSERNQKLLGKLIGWHHVADGGFVGTRDRTVRQINQEKRLLEQTREQAHRLKPQYDDRASLARALSQWANSDPAVECAKQPAPRSFWRGKGAGIGAKLAYPVLVLALWFGSLWLAGALATLLARFDAWLFQRSDSAVQDALRIANQASWCLLAGSGRFVLGLIAIICALLVFFALLPALFKSWRRWLASLRRELDRPSDTWSSRLTYVFVGAVTLLLGTAAAWALLVYTFKPDALFRCTIGMLMPASLGWPHLAGAGATLLVLIGAGIVFYRLDRWFPDLNERFYHPRRDDVERAQQVHPSIEESEAELVGQTAHMISLTDMRSPNWWSVWWSRTILRIVTLAGRVFYTEGRLGHAPGIHFGHWHIIDGGRRYLFCSNFDGTFGGYLDDFINGASIGTTLAWRWTKLKARKAAAAGQPGVAHPRAFPSSRLVVFRGVKCELKFKSYARDSMLPHLFRFDACNTTIDEANRATNVRDALFGERNDGNDDRIMRAIES